VSRHNAHLDRTAPPQLCDVISRRGACVTVCIDSGSSVSMTKAKFPTFGIGTIGIKISIGVENRDLSEQ
jgi:hypothetical protein